MHHFNHRANTPLVNLTSNLVKSEKIFTNDYSAVVKKCGFQVLHMSTKCLPLTGAMTSISTPN